MMTAVLPANITADMANLQTAYASAAPLTTAPSTTVYALYVQAEAAVSDLDAAVLAASGSLDTYLAPTMAPAIATGVLGLLTACQTQSALTDIRGYVGRVALNIGQAI